LLLPVATRRTRSELVTLRVTRSRGEMYIGHGRLSVCPSPHSHTSARTRMWLGGMVRGPSSCALLGGYAISERVSLLWQHSAEREMPASAYSRSMPSSVQFSHGDSVRVLSSAFYLHNKQWFIQCDDNIMICVTVVCDNIVSTVRFSLL